MAKVTLAPQSFRELPVGTDPKAYVISANLHRRHLTAEQKRDLLAELIKIDPSKSNRQIAEDAKVDKNTVKSVRDGLEATGEIHQLEETTGKDGKKRKTKKTGKKKQEPAAHVAYKRKQEELIDLLKETHSSYSQAEEWADNTKQRLDRALQEDRAVNTRAAMHQLLDPTPSGRFAKALGEFTVGSTPTVDYPHLPETSPWSQPQPGLEPPLGIDVSYVEPCGTQAEIERSLSAMAPPAATTPQQVPADSLSTLHPSATSPLSAHADVSDSENDTNRVERAVEGGVFASANVAVGEGQAATTAGSSAADVVAVRGASPPPFSFRRKFV
jgi:DNA-binding transcriptional regulator YhcF (GntR family)